MQFLPKWSQNVSKFILFYKWTAIFKFNINFNFFTNFYISEMFCRYLKMWKIANLGYGNGRNSKKTYPIYMIFGRHMQKTNIYKTMKSFFWFFFQILNYVIKFPIGRFLVTMATASKVRLHGFVRIVFMYHPPNFESTAKIVFWVTFVTVFDQSEAQPAYHGNQT